MQNRDAENNMTQNEKYFLLFYMEQTWGDIESGGSKPIKW